MFSPPLYRVRKIPMKYLIQQNFNVEDSELEQFKILQSDSPLLRQIRLITGEAEKYNPYIVFIDCPSGKNYKDALAELVIKGCYISGAHYVVSERSASMTRNSILSMVRADVEVELSKRITMDIQFEKTVLSKYYAYRGLMLSSCHCVEDYLPKIIVVPDLDVVIPEQHIKYVHDTTVQFEDKETGEMRDWTYKDISPTVRDIKINAFDGCGIHHPLISRELERRIGSKTPMTSILCRRPYIKGLSHEIDYVKFFEEHGVTEIVDVWGEKHGVTADDEPMMIMTESMYKGLKYFKQYGDKRDWESYWERFHRYQHCFGVAKWNFSLDEEPMYTKANYQILQDLELPYEEFAPLAKYSIDWLTKIIGGDMVYTYAFLGLTYPNPVPLNYFCKAILKNPEMLKEYSVREYLISLIEKYKDDMKCGKLWLRFCFKLLSPDLIMLLEHIGGLKPVGCLEADEFFSFNKDGLILGERLIERNPHICKSEHTILKGTINEQLDKYCRHLTNVCMINCKSITPQRLNGADYDGDLIALIDEPTMMKGVDRNASIVIDIDDKITSLEEADTLENKVNVILRGMNSLIGETSNCATAYHNKVAKSDETKEKYNKYIDLLSVINGKAIDSAKTGVIFNIPRHIAKYGRPLPYFMKYASPYYAKLKTFSYRNSNMNRLCKEIERWEKQFRYKRTYKDFKYQIMIDDSIEINEDTFEKIEELYLEFNKKIAAINKELQMIRTYSDYQSDLMGWASKGNSKDFIVNWQYYYDQFKSRRMKICPNSKELANYAVMLCYEKYPRRNKKFMWRVASDGILQNIKPVNIQLPMLDERGNYEYLGKKYDLIWYKWEE